MNPTINRLKIIFLGLFAVGVVGIWAYQIFYVWPAKRCDAQERWWDGKTLTCATPIYIPSLTGRPEGMSRKTWSERQAALKNQKDREGYPTEEAQPVAPPAPAVKPAASATPVVKPAAKP